MIRRLIFPTVLVLSLTGCKTFDSNPGTNMTIANRSSGLVRNVEISYPGGVVGAPQIAPGDSFHKWVPTKECKLQVRFLADNKVQPEQELGLGQSCPKNLTLEIGPDMKVTGRPTQ